MLPKVIYAVGKDDVLEKIVEISESYLCHQPPINIRTLKEELNISVVVLRQLLRQLALAGDISYYTCTNNAIKINNSAVHKPNIQL